MLSLLGRRLRPRFPVGSRPVIALESIIESLRSHRPARLPRPGEVHLRAAVSLVLAGPAEQLSLCVIRRSTRPDDPWSGQMALPGGRASGSDPDLWSAAVRETEEEVGLVLEPAHALGALSEMPIGRRSDAYRGVLSPFVFYLAGTRRALRPQAEEVAEAYWVPLAHLWDPAHRTTLAWGVREYPGIRYREDVIWGLTLWVIDAFATVIERPMNLGATRR